VAKTLSNSNGGRQTIYAYPVQPTSQAGTQQVLQLPTVVVTSSTPAAGTQPPVAIVQTALSGDFRCHVEADFVVLCCIAFARRSTGAIPARSYDSFCA